MSDTDNSDYLAGKILIAMPGMGDPRFEKAVIFLCAHDENGAMGLMINHTINDLNFAQLLDQLGIKSDIEIDLPVPVMNGGPVETSRGFLLHSNEFSKEDTIKIDNSFSVTGTLEALKDIANGKGPKELLFILGYAGWGAGQLEQELQQNAWLVSDPDPEIIFAGAHDIKWSKAVQSMGFDPGMLSSNAGRA